MSRFRKMTFEFEMRIQIAINILDREFRIIFLIISANREKLVKLISFPKLKIPEILLNSLFISSAYANNFAVPSCNDDTQVSY